MSDPTFDRIYWNIRCSDALNAIETKGLDDEHVVMFALMAETILAAKPSARTASGSTSADSSTLVPQRLRVVRDAL